jgi:transcription factor IIIB subunit 2
MLIDFSDVMQVCVYELGRTYLRLSQALCINIPSMGEYYYSSAYLKEYSVNLLQGDN